MKYSSMKHLVTAAIMLATAFMVVDGKRGLIRGDHDEMRLFAFEASEDTDLNGVYFRTSKSMKKSMLKSKKGSKSGIKKSKSKMGLKSKKKNSKSDRRFKSLSKKSKRKNKMRPRSEFGEKLKKEIDDGAKKVKDMFGFGLKSKKSLKSKRKRSPSKKSPSKKSKFGERPSESSKSKKDVLKTKSRRKSQSHSMSKDDAASISNDIDSGSVAAASSENSSSDQMTPPVSMPAGLENTSISKASNENAMDAPETDSEDNVDVEINFERVGEMDRFVEVAEENFGV